MYGGEQIKIIVNNIKNYIKIRVKIENTNKSKYQK